VKLNNRITIRLSEDERAKLDDLAGRFKITPSELARKYLVDGMSQIHEDFNLLRFRIRGLEEQLDENLKYVLSGLAACVLLDAERQANQTEEERKERAREFVGASVRMGARIRVLKVKT